MREEFAMRGKIGIQSAVLQWSAGEITGDKIAVAKFWEISKKYEAGGGFGPIPAWQDKNFNESAFLSALIFREVLAGAVVVTGIDFFETEVEPPEDQFRIY
jgi:hypothetical protein